MNVVPTDSASIYDALNTLVMSPSLLAIVRPENPPPGVAGFIFDIVTEDAVELESEIPDYVNEANVSFQDRIVLRPETVRLSSQIAEVVKTYKTPATTPVAPQGALPLVSGLQPVLTPGAQAAQAARTTTAANVKTAVTSNDSLYSYYLSHLAQQPNATKQSKAFGYVYQLWKGRQRMTIETPWGFFTDMAIQSVSVRQGARTKDASDFWITFKKVRSASSQSIQTGKLAGRAVFQQANATQSGVVGLATPTTAQTGQFNNQIAPPPRNP